MTQTLYAFLTVVLITTFSLTQRTALVKSRIQAIQNDLDLIGSGIAAEQLDYITSLPFDSQGTVSSASDLTPSSDFGLGSATYMASTDVDDFHHKTLNVKVPAFSDTLQFDVSVYVRYVEQSGSSYISSSSPTYYKEVSLSVDGEGISTVSLSRITTY